MKDTASFPSTLKYCLASLACIATLFLLYMPLQIGRKPTTNVDLELGSDATNQTLGFQRVYVIYSDPGTQSLRNFKAIAALLDIDAQYVRQTGIADAAILRQQNQYLADLSDIAELDTHTRIYATMAKQDIQSALILSSSVDVELDIKLRLASALGDITDLYDILFVGRQYSEPTEPDAEEVLNFLQQTNKTSDPSAQMQRLWIKRRFLDRKTALYRTSFPEGATAYAVSGRMARRLYHRLRQRMAIDHHDLDYILADVAMLGLSLAYSISPPPVTAYGLDRAISGQFLARSALHSMSLRQDDPSTLPPYNDWKDAWEGLKY